MAKSNRRCVRRNFPLTLIRLGAGKETWRVLSECTHSKRQAKETMSGSEAIVDPEVGIVSLT